MSKTKIKEQRWSTAQIRIFVASAIRGVGGASAWDLLVPRLREAVIAEYALNVLRQQVRGISVDVADELLIAMLVAAGLHTKEERK